MGWDTEGKERRREGLDGWMVEVNIVSVWATPDRGPSVPLPNQTTRLYGVSLIIYQSDMGPLGSVLFSLSASQADQ